jgi:predicted RNA binding protein YcfA (HicA-like mRNA interferase family)
MPKRYSSKYIIRVLEKNGFFFVSQKGSHTKYKKEGKPTLIVIVPIYDRQICSRKILKSKLFLH